MDIETAQNATELLKKIASVKEEIDALNQVSDGYGITFKSGNYRSGVIVFKTGYSQILTLAKSFKEEELGKLEAELKSL